MKLTNLTLLRLEINPETYVSAPQDRKNLWYLLDRLFSGQEVSADEFTPYGLKIAVEDEFLKIGRME